MNYLEKKELLRRFRNQELNPEAHQLFFQLMKDGDYQADFDRMLEEIEREAADDGQEADSESLLKIKGRLHSQIEPAAPIRRRFRIGALTAAASLFMVIGLGLLYYFNQPQAQSYKTVSVPRGKLILLKLQDGSEIKLVSGSTFKYPDFFGDRQRVVYLIEGKAYFNVAHDKKRPFTVRSGELATTALGTTFTVQYNKEYRWEKVNLYTGKVVIKHKSEASIQVSDSTFLNPGEFYELSNNGVNKDRFENTSADQDPVGQGELSFSSTPFEEAVYQIASYYKIHIHFNKADLSSYKINGAFKGQSAEEVLQTLTQMYALKLKKSSDSTYSIMTEIKK